MIAGTLDITAAFINSWLHGVGPLRVLRSIASGLLGAQARNGGIGTTALGLGLHFLIALGAATVYYAASRKLDLLTRHAIICGLLYGQDSNLSIVTKQTFDRGTRILFAGPGLQ